MRDYGEILNSMRICLNVDRDSNCLSECFGCKYITNDHHVMDMVRDAADAIEELAAERDRALKRLCEWCGVCSEENRKALECDDIAMLDATHWISVEERLPETDDFVIVAILDDRGDTPYQYTDFGWYLDVAKCWIVNAEQRRDVTHWMPLPEPPKEVE